MRTPLTIIASNALMEADGYKFMDYIKAGASLLLLFFITTLLWVPLI